VALQPHPPRRGPAIAIALLVVGLLASTTLAVVQTARLKEAQGRIEELEEEVAEGGGGGGGFVDEFQEIFEDLLGEGDAEVGEAAAGFGDLLQCLSPQDGSPGGATAPAGGGGTVEQEVASIADQVERIRGLEFSRAVQPEFLSGDETGARVQNLFLEEYTAEMADQESRVLAALGAIPQGTDLRELRAETLGQQVAGFYDPETGELVVRAPGGELTPLDKVTLSHELEHALADQRLDLPVPDDVRTGSEDADLAALALVEGDATLTMQRFSQALPFDEQLGLLDPEAVAEAESGLAELSSYLEQELLFPYEQGVRFVCGLYAEGGWDAVNAAYSNPPQSTAQVLFPERYVEGEQPVDPRPAADPPPRRWEPTGVRQFGAANLLWLFEAPGGHAAAAVGDPEAAAKEWAGGQVQLWTRGGHSIVALVLVDRPGGGRLCEAVAEWYRRAIPDDRESHTAGPELVTDGPVQDAVLTCAGDEVRLGIAPNGRAASAVVR
jgi:hypothetical protein